MVDMTAKLLHSRKMMINMSWILFSYFSWTSNPPYSGWNPQNVCTRLLLFDGLQIRPLKLKGAAVGKNPARYILTTTPAHRAGWFYHISPLWRYCVLECRHGRMMTQTQDRAKTHISVSGIRPFCAEFSEHDSVHPILLIVLLIIFSRIFLMHNRDHYDHIAELLEPEQLYNPVSIVRLA